MKLAPGLQSDSFKVGLRLGLRILNLVYVHSTKLTWTMNKRGPCSLRHIVWLILLPGRQDQGALNPPNTWDSQRVQVLGFWVIVIIVQVLGEYMIIRYLDP